jgi:integrase
MGTGLVRKIVIDVAKSAGYNPKLEFVSAHSFRHWHAQRLIRLGASIDQVQSVLGHARAQTTKDIYAPEPNMSQVVQERLGHSQISLTLDTYSHVIPAMQAEAASKLDELLTPIAVDLQYKY